MYQIPRDEIEFTVECLEEDMPIEGNVCATGDLVEDKEQEHWVRRQLREGNEWAWCTVKVSASWNGLTAEDYLGCCSYESAEDFKQPGGYYDDMKAEAAAELDRMVHDQQVRQPQILDSIDRALHAAAREPKKLGYPILESEINDANDKLHISTHIETEEGLELESVYQVTLTKVK